MNAVEMTPEAGFIERVERLSTGELAALRRGCGERDPVEGRCPWLVGIVHGASREAAAFLAASLLAQYKTSDIRAGRHRAVGDFGTTWKRAVTGAESQSIRRRFNIALDADYDSWTGEGDLPHRLRQMVRYAASKDVGVEWPALLRDLKFWNHPEKFVQKRWARSFFAPDLPEDTADSQPRED